MEPIGKKLKDTRIAKGLFIEQIAIETNISKKYIEAIEEERFDDFPGEAYFIGFLCTYADYLELDGKEFVKIYKNLKIQEQPIPEELFASHNKFKLIHVIIILFILIIGVGGVYLFISRTEFFPVAEKEAKALANKKIEEIVVTGIEYEMASSFVERRFEVGDAIVVNHKDIPYKLLIKKSKKSLVLVMPQEEVELVRGKEFFSDFDGDNNYEIRVAVKDVDSDGAVIKFDRNTEAPAVALSGISTEEELSDVSASAVIAAGTVSSTNPTFIQSRRKWETVVLESSQMAPFTINLSFRGYCLMRYEADGGRREEKYFHQGDTFRFNVSQNIKMWLSNAGAVIATVNDAPYSFGKAGAVSSVMLRWNRKASGGYELKSVSLN